MKKDKEWKILDILIAFIIMIIIGGIVSYFFLKLHFLKHLPEQLFIVTGSFFMTLSGTIFLLFKYPLNLSSYGFRRAKFKETLAWGGISGLIISIVGFPYSVVVSDYNVPQEFFVSFQNEKYNAFIFLFVVLVLIPLVEELFFRACLYRILKNRFDVFWGYVVSTAFFTLGHGLSQPQEVIIFIINSSILTYIYEKTGSIGTSIIAHALWSFTWFGAIYSYHMGLIPT